MDPERSLISRAIHGGHLDDLIARGIEVDHFADEECQKVYGTMLAHFSKYGEPPTEEAVRDAHPEMRLEVSSEAIDYLLDRFVRDVKRRLAIDLYRDFGDAIDDDRVEEIEMVAMEMASALLDVVPSPTAGRYSDAENRIDDYFRRLEAGEPPGLMTGYPQIDRYTVGIQDHEFGVVAGWQNSGKSMVMQRWALNVYEDNEDKTPLYISLEMSRDECYGRWDTMATGIEHRALRALELGEGDIAKLREAAARAKDFRAERDIICIDDIGSCTPDRVLVETRRYQPAIVFVDYLELMDPPRTAESEWQGINMIGKQLKRNARIKINGKHIPIVVGAQTNADDGGKGASLGNISYKSTGKHADIVLGITRTAEMEAEKRMNLELLKNRNGARSKVDELHCEPERMELRPASMKQEFEARKARQEARTSPATAAALANTRPSPFRGRTA